MPVTSTTAPQQELVMVITRIESVPQLWDEERDGAFFRLMCGVFSADFLYGASVLLAGNDLDAAPERLVATGKRRLNPRRSAPEVSRAGA
jgi:hypothetical protein